MNGTLERKSEFDDFFCLAYGAEESAALTHVQRFAREQLEPLRQGPFDPLAREAALTRAEQLGLAELASVEPDRSADAFSVLDLLVAEELAAGDLESGIELLLPLIGSAWAQLVLGCEAAHRTRAYSTRSVIGLGFRTERSNAAHVLSRSTAGTVAALRDAGEALEVWLLDVEPTLANSDAHRFGFRTLHIAEVPVDRTSVCCAVAWAAAAPLLERTALVLCAGLVGAMRSAVRFAFEYAKGRSSFGKPIIAHQAVGLRIAGMLQQLEAAKLMLWRAAWQRHHGDGQGVRLAVAQAEAASREVFRDGLQVCGAHGYVEGLGPYHWFQQACYLRALARRVANLRS